MPFCSFVWKLVERNWAKFDHMLENQFCKKMAAAKADDRKVHEGFMNFLWVSAISCNVMTYG